MRPSPRAFVSIVEVAALASLAMGAPARPGPERAAPATALQIRLDNQAITPISARFIERAVARAEQEAAECLIIVLDTPGGLVEPTRATVKHILGSEVPVVVYVAPSGARAASAGMFITLAGHVAAMAPGTNIGAAHPVQIGGLPTTPPEKSGSSNDEHENGAASPVAPAGEEKIVNDTVAWARALAELRGRNAEWAARAVRESISAPASEAVEEQAVDLVARDVNDLLRKIDGREVELPRGVRRLSTADAQIRVFEMWWGEKLLALAANPNVAFLLLVFGFYGVLFELYSPGWGVAGTLGIVCLLIALLTLAVLPINAVGLALITIALVMFVAEAFVISFGALTAGGVVCLVLGAVMLVDSPAGFQRVSLWVVLPVALATALITVFLVGSVVKAHRGRRLTGAEALIGAEAVAEEPLSGEDGRYVGMVRVGGELWKAVSAAPAGAGERLTIQDRQGLTLVVHRFDPQDGRPAPSDAASPSVTE